MNEKPNITISSLDAERLEKMINALGSEEFSVKEKLLEELDRADIVAPADIPPSLVTMNSTVTFRTESTGKEFSLTLVYPEDSTEGETTVSVLAPVGSALLGLTEGDQMDWPKPGGGLLSVQIIKVEYQPERAGEFHR